MQRSENIKDNTIIFIHIPKTGGRTLESILERQYSSNAIYNLYGYEDSIPNAAQDLADLSPSQQEKFKLIKGHIQFGLHNVLSKPCSYITMLRNPVDRVVSHYNYVLGNEMHPLHSVIKSRNMNISDYVISGITNELNNGQTRLLSGQEDRYDYGCCPHELLERALENIETRFAFVGLLERFDESIVLMADKLDFSPVTYTVKNRTKGKMVRNLSDSDLAAIEKYNSLDIELYNFVEKELSNLVSKNGKEIDQKIELMKARNSSIRARASVSFREIVKKSRSKLKSLVTR